MVSVTYQGPMPPPAMLAEYDRVVPGSAAKIIEMARSEQVHRHTMERRETSFPFLSLAFGGVALLGSVAGATTLAILDKAPLLQAALIGVPVLGTIGYFVKARIVRSSR